ncbi:hypothetical protein [Streptomyces sp. MK37H]|nr:hypothetical protein [Streptomyces sp. MK37H]
MSAEAPPGRRALSKLDIIDVGHFVWEEGADDYAKAVTGWWRAN